VLASPRLLSPLRALSQDPECTPLGPWSLGGWWAREWGEECWHNNSVSRPLCDKQTCLNQPSCVVSSAGFPDPCGGVIKSIAIEASCQGSPGGQQLVSVQSCALDNPCPLPSAPWTFTWQLNRSTIAQVPEAAYNPGHPAPCLCPIRAARPTTHAA
jgi:hypothetical protein